MTLPHTLPTEPIPVLHIQKVTSLSGSENHLLSLLPRLQQYGYQPTMVTLVDGSNSADLFIERMREAGITTLAIRIRTDLDLTLPLRLARLIRRGKYRIVHTHLIHGDLYGALAATISGTKCRLISSRHNDDAFRRLLPVRLINGGLARLEDRIICISDHVRRFEEQVEFTPPKKIDVVHYGLGSDVPEDRSWRTSKGWDTIPVIGIVARLTAQKGHSTLLDAFQTVQNAIPDVQLVIVGDGELREPLVEQVKRLNLEHCTHFLGYQPNARAFMSNFDVLVHPSRWEGFGLVFLEAMAAKLPIVATLAGAAPEIIVDGATGLLVEADDTSALANALIILLQNPQKARRMGEAGYHRLIEQFTMDAMVRKTANVYDQVLMLVR